MYGSDKDAFALFMQDVKRIPPLTTDEEHQLLAEIEQSWVMQERARNRLVEGCQFLIMSVAQRYQSRCQFLELLDLIQEGNEALLRALEHYHRDEGEFRTYAYRWVRGAMFRAISQHERMIRLPQRQVTAITAMARRRDQLLLELGHEPTVAELATSLRTTQERIRDLQVLEAQHVASLDMLCGKDEDISLADLIPDPTTLDRDRSLTTLREFVSRLPLREQALILLRYDLKENCVRSQKEVAAMMNMSPSLVEILDRRIRRRLRASLAASPA